MSGRYVYLHAGGALGPDGRVESIDVQLPPELVRFRLPDASDHRELTKAVECSSSFLDAGPFHLTLPIFAAIYRAVLGDVDFSVFLTGATGTGKTTLAALAQQHFGSAMDARHLPGS